MRITCGYKRFKSKCLKPRIFHSHYAYSTIKVNSGLELDQGYVPHNVAMRSSWYEYFKPPIKDSSPFTMILPPPNITGTLHLGHALTVTTEDILIRWKSMKGIETVWIPGMDHAGIATQVVVEKNLWKTEKKLRHDIGREAFRERVWEWKKEKADIIWGQMKQLNISLDWKRQMFTLDDKHTRAVEEAFIKLFEAGLIYRADRLVNWSCVLQSTISDIEIEHISINGPTLLDIPGYENPVEFGVLVSFAYKLKDSDEEIIVTTTRPETMIGDVAVAVHPDDQRYARLIGSQLWHPFRKEFIPIVGDRFVDPEFGTGAVKITPAHDKADFDVGLRHKLPLLKVLDETGQLTSACGQFQGVRRFDARKIIVDELANSGLYRGKIDNQMTVPICSRSRDVVEQLVKSQWYIKSEEMASKAIRDVREKRLNIIPKNFETTWFSWLENIRDWCISRQLWWGHQIPAYKCYPKEDPENHIWVAAPDEDSAFRKAVSKLGREDLVVARDEDVLDTWFSSALLPMSVFGWPEKTEDLERYYPLSLMETGHDILFFWAARMVLLGNELMGRLPFNQILLHGIVCDSQGRKMSKSIGNVITPEQIIEGMTLEEMEETLRESHEAGILSDLEFSNALKTHKKIYPNGIPECGADALRFTLVSHNIKNNFINFDVSECHTNKLFCNKIWQATRFMKSKFDFVSKSQRVNEIEFEELTKMDRWILSRLSNMVTTVDESIEVYDFHVATNALKSFLYYDLCDIYLESTKRGLRNPDSDVAVGHCYVLHKCLDVGIRTLAPFMPTLATHLHERLPWYPSYTRSLYFPERLKWHDLDLENDIKKVMELVVAVRRMKKLFNITAKDEPKVYIMGNSLFWNDYFETVEDLAGCYKVIVRTSETENPIKEKTVTDTVGDTSYHLVIPERHRQNIDFDLQKMELKTVKLYRDLLKMHRMTSGENYKIKVSPESQEAHSRKITSIQDQINRIEYMKKLLENM